MENTNSSPRFKSLFALLLSFVFLANLCPPNECRYLRRVPIKRFGEIAGSWNDPAWSDDVEDDFVDSYEDGMGRVKRVGRACGTAAEVKRMFYLNVGCAPGRSKLCECYDIGFARCTVCK